MAKAKARRASKKRKKPVRDLKALEKKSRHVVGGGRAIPGPLGKRI
jgi:hypothetical protein